MDARRLKAATCLFAPGAREKNRREMIGPPVLRRRILKGSGQPDRQRAAVLMEGGGDAFMSYMNFGDEQDRSSFPSDDLAAQCAFVLGHLPGCDTGHITAPCMGKKARPLRDALLEVLVD